jgi:hypothetical protein
MSTVEEMQKVLELGAHMGLKDGDLQQFVKNEQSKMRDEREKLRAERQKQAE